MKYLLDEKFPVHEQLPRSATFVFIDEGEYSKMYVYTKMGLIWTLRSASFDWEKGDGYRWGYAFHLALMTNLCWSPVLRDILGLKRRSKKYFEKIEDAPRVQVLEEALCMMVFESIPDKVNINTDQSYNMETFQEPMKFVRKIMHKYEIRDVCDSAWHEAFVCGVKAWSLLHANRGGILQVNMGDKKLEFQYLPRI